MAVQTDAYLKGRFITGAKPTETDFSDLIDSKARITHTHAIADVTGLQDALDAASGGSTAWGDITGTLSNQTDLNSALNGKAATSHTHSGATTSVAGFMSAADKVKLNGLDSTNYAPTSHEHVKADITDLASSELVPSGGTDGQVVTKVAGVPAWADAAGGGGGVWEELASGSLATTTDLTLTGLDSSDTLYRFICRGTTSNNVQANKTLVNSSTTNTIYNVNINTTNGTVGYLNMSRAAAYGSAAFLDIYFVAHNGKVYIENRISESRTGFVGNWAQSEESSISSLVLQFNKDIEYKFYGLTI